MGFDDAITTIFFVGPCCFEIYEGLQILLFIYLRAGGAGCDTELRKYT